MGTLNRFGVTVLSRKNKGTAVPEELMVHKEIGQVLIKTITGDIVSFDSLTRQKMHIEDVTSRATNLGITGDLFSVDIPTTELPEVILDNVNVLDSSLLLQSVNPKSILISVDLDYLNLVDTETVAEFEPDIILNFNFKKTVNSVLTENPGTITDKLSVINNMIIDPARFFVAGTDITGHSMHLDSIKVRRHTAYPGSTPMRNILYGVLVIID
jgi:hypothetical protein